MPMASAPEYGGVAKFAISIHYDILNESGKGGLENSLVQLKQRFLHRNFFI
jgi:hypothetical protein